MTNIIENNFEGSPLQTELRNANGEKFLKHKQMTIQALENNPTSLFWQNAVKFCNSLKK